MTHVVSRRLASAAWLILLAAVAAMATACSHLDVQTFQNPDVTIPAAATYGWRSAPLGKERPAELDPRVHNALVHERIREAIESVLASKGFRQGDAETADFLVEYRVGVWSKLREVHELNLAVLDAPSDPTAGGYASGPYGPPIAITTQSFEAMEGGLLITLYERKTGKIAYRALGRDDNVRKRDASERAISNTVTRLLKDLP